nr:MAG TPA: hypothetical protein [Caudoviricetes sp.]
MLRYCPSGSPPFCWRFGSSFIIAYLLTVFHDFYK